MLNNIVFTGFFFSSVLKQSYFGGHVFWLIAWANNIYFIKIRSSVTDFANKQDGCLLFIEVTS